MILLDKERIEWFWARVHKTSSCWLYKGAKSRVYGHFYHNKVHQFAHHFSWKLENNLDWTIKLFLLHNCDTPACVHPKHLEVETHKKNSQDMITRRRGRGQFEKGFTPKRSFFTKEKAFEIRGELNKFRLPNGKLKYGTLTKFEKKYNVSKACLSALAKGETYQ